MPHIPDKGKRSQAEGGQEVADYSARSRSESVHQDSEKGARQPKGHDAQGQGRGNLGAAPAEFIAYDREKDTEGIYKRTPNDKYYKHHAREGEPAVKNSLRAWIFIYMIH